MASFGELRQLLQQHGAWVRVSRFRALGARRGTAYVEYHLEVTLRDGTVETVVGRSLQQVLDEAAAFVEAKPLMSAG